MKAQKISILNELNISGITLSELARQYQISSVALYRWRKTMNKEITHFFFQTINKILDEGKPIGLEYRSGDVLKYHDSFFGDHVSVLLARRWNEEK